MLKQYAGEALEKDVERFEYWADQFEKLPMFYQRFFGSTEMTKILAIIDFAVQSYDVAHIVLDNLQFMLSGQGKGYERFEIQDDLISKIRGIATEKNVHITIVIHPKKTDDNADLSVASIFGTSKATQEADNIFIIQNRSTFKILEIKKNRFDGSVGKIALIFDRATKRYYAINNNDVQHLMAGKSISEILKAKILQAPKIHRSLQSSPENPLLEKYKELEKEKLNSGTDTSTRETNQNSEEANESQNNFPLEPASYEFETNADRHFELNLQIQGEIRTPELRGVPSVSYPQESFDFNDKEEPERLKAGKKQIEEEYIPFFDITDENAAKLVSPLSPKKINSPVISKDHIISQEELSSHMFEMTKDFQVANNSSEEIQKTSQNNSSDNKKSQRQEEAQNLNKDNGPEDISVDQVQLEIVSGEKSSEIETKIESSKSETENTTQAENTNKKPKKTNRATTSQETDSAQPDNTEKGPKKLGRPKKVKQIGETESIKTTETQVGDNSSIEQIGEETVVVQKKKVGRPKKVKLQSAEGETRPSDDSGSLNGSEETVVVQKRKPGRPKKLKSQPQEEEIKLSAASELINPLEESQKSEKPVERPVVQVMSENGVI